MDRQTADRGLLKVLEWFSEHSQGTANYIATEAQSTESEVLAHLSWLRFLGLLTDKGGGVYALTHELHCRHFIQSMIDFGNHGRVLFANFAESGSEQPWVQVLSALEHRRRCFTDHNKPHRIVPAAIAIIVGAYSGKRYILVEVARSMSGNRYKFIGGSQEPDEADPRETIQRELAEEIQTNIGDVLELRTTPRVIGPFLQVSPSCGALSEYTFALWEVVRYTGLRINYSGTMDHALKWLDAGDLETMSAQSATQLTNAICDQMLLDHVLDTQVVYPMSKDDAGRIIAVP